MNTLISTWKMSYTGMKKAQALLERGCTVSEAILCVIQDIESNPSYHSVGYGGLPNEDGQVELDAAYMNGNTLGYGGVMAVKNLKSPIEAAYSLSQNNVNCLLAAEGASQYAQEKGFAFQDNLTMESQARWKLQQKTKLQAYEGHDTVCVLGKVETEIAVGVSTSGLFMKHAGRVGDSPIIGSGFYADAKVGACACTGLGEDILRGCLSIRIVDAMGTGKSPQEACDFILDKHMDRMMQAKRVCDAISIIAMDKDGNVGATTNLACFPFVVLQQKLHFGMASYQEGRHEMHMLAYEDWQAINQD